LFNEFVQYYFSDNTQRHTDECLVTDLNNNKAALSGMILFTHVLNISLLDNKSDRGFASAAPGIPDKFDLFQGMDNNEIYDRFIKHNGMNKARLNQLFISMYYIFKNNPTAIDKHGYLQISPISIDDEFIVENAKHVHHHEHMVMLYEDNTLCKTVLTLKQGDDSSWELIHKDSDKLYGGKSISQLANDSDIKIEIYGKSFKPYWIPRMVKYDDLSDQLKTRYRVILYCMLRILYLNRADNMVQYMCRLFSTVYIPEANNNLK
jgi:hypothetical protein